MTTLMHWAMDIIVHRPPPGMVALHMLHMYNKPLCYWTIYGVLHPGNCTSDSHYFNYITFVRRPRNTWTIAMSLHHKHMWYTLLCIRQYLYVPIQCTTVNRSIRCASQNTETVTQTFRQPTASFITESLSSHPGVYWIQCTVYHYHCTFYSDHYMRKHHITYCM